MDKNTRPMYMLPPRDPPQIERYTQTKSKRIEEDISCKWKGKNAGVAILTSDKIGLKVNIIVRHREGHYIIIREQ